MKVTKTSRTYLFLLLLTGFTACFTKSKVTTLKQPDLILAIKQDSGTNGSSVAYNPKKQVYYTCFAGNPKYPLETYNDTGLAVFTDNCGLDIRGMWYNPNNNYLEINGYNNTGIRTLLMDENGWASNTIYTLIPHGNQPEPNSCPAYDYDSNQLIYYVNCYLIAYNRDDLEFKKTIAIELPCDTQKINSSTAIYTGIEKKEVGLFNYIDKAVYLFDIKTGKLTHTLNIPKNVPTTRMLNFSYANNKVWFFNRQKREWWGFEIK